MGAFRLIEGVSDAREVGYLAGSRLRVQPLRVAILADLYYRSMKHYKTYSAERDRVADTAATIGATVGSIAVIALSGGTASPAVVAMAAAAVGGVSAGTVTMAVRGTDFDARTLRNVGAGALDGFLAVVGAGLAARAVRGTMVANQAANVAVKSASVNSLPAVS